MWKAWSSTQEVERLELPEVDELSAESAGEFGEDTADSSGSATPNWILARTYLEMWVTREGHILQEVVNEGSEQQKLAAQKMMERFILASLGDKVC